MNDPQFDLFRPPELFPPQPATGPRPGELRGDLSALDAAARGIEIYMGDKYGWRRFGEAPPDLGPPTALFINGRCTVSRHWYVDLTEEEDRAHG